MTIKPDIARGNGHLERVISWIQLLLYKVSFLRSMCCFKAVCESLPKPNLKQWENMPASILYIQRVVNYIMTNQNNGLEEYALIWGNM